MMRERLLLGLLLLLCWRMVLEAVALVVGRVCRVVLLLLLLLLLLRMESWRLPGKKTPQSVP